MRRVVVWVFAIALAAGVPAGDVGVRLVLCAPGYPGNTASAQPSLDKFAQAATAAAGWPEGSLAASYHESEEGGVAALREPDAGLALVAWPFFVNHAAALGLTPIGQADSKDSGPEEAWSLVAKKGRLSVPSNLSGWEIISLAAYSPQFVREELLASWGALPPDVRLTPGSQVLSALRRASSGERVAVLLDGAQTAGLATLPYASDVEVVAVSRKVPVAVLCAVDGRLRAERSRAFAAALRSMHLTPQGADALAGLRLVRFVPSSVPRPARKTGARVASP